MADKRAYFKLDVGYLTNPKVVDVSVESTSAVLLHIGSIAYSAQHLTDGHVPIKLLLRLTGASESDAQILFNSGLWIPDGDKGAIVHDYLEHQRSSSEARGAADKSRAAARARWDRSSMPPSMHRASEPSMPREREREREEDTSAIADDPTRPDVEDLCAYLADLIEGNGSKRPAITKAWKEAARLMLDKDGHTQDQIRRAIDWCQADEFWRPNIMSMPKLRQKYDTLRLQAQRDGGGQPKPQGKTFWDRGPV